MHRRRLHASLLVLALAGCRAGDSVPLDPLASEGRRVYMNNCIACHNTNPNLPGAVGPEIAGSPHELVEARVMRAEYPPGYTPKRDSHVMPPLPQLAPEIDALVAYLGAVAK